MTADYHGSSGKCILRSQVLSLAFVPPQQVTVPCALYVPDSIADHATAESQ